MKFDKQWAFRFCAFYLLFNALLFACACNTSWVTEAENIINVLIPAVQGILIIAAGLGATALTPTAIDQIQKWGLSAQADLQNVVLPLLNQYNAAAATAQPGILTEIETALTTITNNLQTILPALHVTDPATQAKITAIVTEVADEFQAVLNIIPVVKSAAAGGNEAVLKALAANHAALEKLKSAGQFKKDFNTEAAAFGPQFANWIK
jgi:hypothetical protein